MNSAIRLIRGLTSCLVMMTVAAVASAAESVKVETFKPLPEAASSFGAVVSDGYLYVYGGHITKTHAYHVGCQSAKFHRLALNHPEASWEELPSGPAVQGMNLAAYKGKVIRAGGMESRNPEGKKAENFSIAEVAAFDPAKGTWDKLPPLPTPRSSHDVAVIGDKLYVLGGWHMKGNEGNDWLSDIHVLDLSTPGAAWETFKAPFERRALIAAVNNNKLYVLGGFDEDSEASKKVDIYDPATGKWSSGPDLPGEQLNGFAPAACSIAGDLYVSMGDGTLAKLDEQAHVWEKVAKTTPRIVHRLAPWQSRILIVGGAAKGNNLDLIEAVTVTTAKTDAESCDKCAEKSASALPALATQKYCPIMTGVLIGNDSYMVDYKGVQVALCCSTCLKKWKADPDAYIQLSLLPQLKDVAPATREIQQVYCPVYKDRVVSAKDPSMEYQGKTIYFFNKSAMKKFQENPEKYADPKILPQLAAK